MPTIQNRKHVNCITPPHILKRLLESDNKKIRDAALNTLLSTEQLRGERNIRGLTFIAPPGASRRSIFDCKHSTVLQIAQLKRTEGDPPVNDESVNRAFDGFGSTRGFYETLFDRDSIDNRGMDLSGFVHRGNRYNNAFWDGQEMVFGDGDGEIFTDFTASLDVIAHELTHGVTEYTANLEYHNQSGALNESISDVFGSLVKQWTLTQTADEADWLIGAEVFTPAFEGDALRSMKAPGTAYDNEIFGSDPQPDNMSNYQNLPDTDDGDNGGVHINSGIPNKAFYLAASGIGGYAWETAGPVWYDALLASNSTTDFQQFADTTFLKAGQRYGIGSREQKAVADAWSGVGIKVSGTLTAKP